MSGNSWVVPLVAGAVGACLGSVATATLMSPPAAAGPRGPDAAEMQRAFSAALQPVQKTLDERLRAVEAGLARTGGAPESASRESPVAPAANAADARPADAAARPSPRVPDEKRLDELTGGFEDGDVRRRWLLTPEADLLAYFGTPDELQVQDTREVWLYWTTSGDTITRKTGFTLSSGRVTSFWQQDVNPPQRTGRTRR